jgi:hypothetical protein
MDVECSCKDVLSVNLKNAQMFVYFMFCFTILPLPVKKKFGQLSISSLVLGVHRTIRLRELMYAAHPSVCYRVGERSVR